MTHAIVQDETGGPDVLSYREVPDPVAGPGEIVVRHTAIGLNYLDTYFRKGLYPAPGGMPLTIGNEAAGVVESIGDGVTLFAPGDRVAYAGSIGAYSQRRAIEADKVVAIPEGVSDEMAAAMMLKGMTARYLLKEVYKVEKGSTILYHAAAGGVGLIMGQWAKALGATAIGTVSSAEKAELAKANGYAHVINYSDDNFVEAVKTLTDGKGVDVVYDSIGKDTYPSSLDCLRPMGMWATFGQSSGVIENFSLGDLASRGSLFATRPSLFVYIGTRPRLEANAADLFKMVADGSVKIEIGQTFPLEKAADAHRALEGRKTTGSTVLVP
ncbi:quinone oxidoreductase [Acuticoccus sp. MNP-M23]|uniref:quinone oxidoreductase family protein n=1 Tax=Acuticoccus sp. MNP-M23 TaxID=3072793 RepID=UPI0028164E5C|nr:quinone oxidoreductase [Acuticoccus sp. MNP-M23]WMS42174.1 quinone oxidoreductase [Acuticoccus sp. MNP-M23]